MAQPLQTQNVIASAKSFFMFIWRQMQLITLFSVQIVLAKTKQKRLSLEVKLKLKLKISKASDQKQDKS